MSITTAAKFGADVFEIDAGWRRDLFPENIDCKKHSELDTVH